LKSGTLYPLLMRLNAEGLLEAEWRSPVEPGRPPRHVYRLSETGMQVARALNEHEHVARVSPVPRGAT
jgi:DNA-binding PadR family transcriptional regulator